MVVAAACEGMIACDAVVFDRELYPRIEHSIEVIQRYRLNLDGLPPIVLNKEHVLVDGFHRLAAYRQEGRSQIPFVTVDVPRDRILVEAVRLNSKHGHSLSETEKKALAERFRLEGKRQEEIAEILGVGQSTVAEWEQKVRGEAHKERNHEVKRLAEEGHTQAEIAEQTGLTQQGISKILVDTTNIGADNSCTDDGLSKGITPDPLHVFNVWNFPVPATEYGAAHRFGTVDPQVIEHLLHYFSRAGDLVVDPMAGNGVTIDVCRRFNRRWKAYDIRPVHPDVTENDITKGLPEDAHGCDLMILDPPYFNNMVKDAYPTLEAFYDFIRRVAQVASETVRPGGMIAFIMTDGDHHRFVPLIDKCHVIFRVTKLEGDRKLEDIARISSPLPTNTSGTAPIVDRAKRQRQILYRDRVIHVYRRPE